jgi:hypothetical protein
LFCEAVDVGHGCRQLLGNRGLVFPWPRWRILGSFSSSYPSVGAVVAS